MEVYTCIDSQNYDAILLLFVTQGWSKRNAFHICITSYNIAVTDHRAFKQKKWRYIILDEVHYRILQFITNPQYPRTSPYLDESACALNLLS